MAGSSMLIRMAMMAMTTSSSMSVKPRSRPARQVERAMNGIPEGWRQAAGTPPRWLSSSRDYTTGRGDTCADFRSGRPADVPAPRHRDGDLAGHAHLDHLVA